MSLEAKIEKYIDSSVREGGFVGKTIVCMRKMGFTQWARKVWIRAIYRSESKNPTDEMKKSRIFFDEHKEDIEHNLLLLADEESKNTYIKAIKFRCSHKLKDFPDYNTKDQYFVKGIVPKKDDYVFVDGGAYIGDTAEQFIDFCDNKYKRIICFEPDPKNLIALERCGEGNERFEIIRKGMWNEQTTLSFSLDQTASKISEEGEVKIAVTALDDEEACKEASFIKMDLEGAELNALKGSVEIIRKNRPVLAICIYHSDEDMINIIQWVEKLGLNYSLYVRHHSFDVHETVMYAIPQ